MANVWWEIRTLQIFSSSSTLRETEIRNAAVLVQVDFTEALECCHVGWDTQ